MGNAAAINENATAAHTLQNISMIKIRLYWHI